MALQVRTIRLPDKVWEDLEDEAMRQGISVAHLIRNVLLLYLNAERPASKRRASKKRGEGN